MAAQLRLFVALDPSPAVRERIARELPELRKLAPGAKWVKEDSLHVTLAFLGSVDEGLVPSLGEAIGAVTRRHAPLDLTFTGGGAFRGKRPRVLWVGLLGAIEALAAMHAELEAALAPFGYQAEDRAFTAHLTLARARDPRGDAALAACAEAIAAVEFGPTRASEIVLYESRLSPKGPTYTALARLPLGG